jgi:hypothetical protein
MLDLPTRTIQTQSAPENAGTKHLGNPDAVTLKQIQAKAAGDFGEWVVDRRNRRAIPHRMERCGYTPIRNNDAGDGLWVINKTRQAVYARAMLSPEDRYRAAMRIVRSPRGKL